MKIQVAINQFLAGKGKNKGRRPQERYASFDYCYNYFYDFYKNGKIKELSDSKNMQTSCLQIGFYLASWGMMRGSSFLLEKSIKNFESLIRAISNMSPLLWEIDVDTYTDSNIKLLLDCKHQIINALGETNNPSDTLITKIMLGVFGNVPAYDQYVKKGLKIRTFNKKSLQKIKHFYEGNKTALNSFKIHTFDFLTSKETSIPYTKAKIVDMYGFMNGQ